MQTEADIYNHLFSASPPPAGVEWPNLQRVGSAGPLTRVRFSDSSEALVDSSGRAFPPQAIARQELEQALVPAILSWLLATPLRLWPQPWQKALASHVASQPWLGELLSEVLPPDASPPTPAAQASRAQAPR